VTKRFPAAELVHDLCERAKVDIARCDQLWPIVQEHSRRGGTRMPAGAEGGGHPEGVHSDPTADAVLAAMERPTEPEVVMRRTLLKFLDALFRLDMARKAMEAQVPAMAAALSQGRKVTDGRTMAEVVALRERGRAIRGDIVCLACQRPAARLLSGFDEACYRSWARAGRPERPGWIVQRRRWLEEQTEQRAEIVVLAMDNIEWDASRHMGSSQGLAVTGEGYDVAA
jgi:hypothetical protein